MTERIFHPTAGVHTTIKSVKDEHGHRHYVYGKGTYEGRGVRDHQNEPNNWQSRNGVDIIVPAGTPIYAAFDGVVGDDFGPLPKHAKDGPDSKFAGNRLTLQGADNSAYYAHLQDFADGIAPGVEVKQGQLIGYSGTAGNVQHLHIAIEKGNTEQFLKDARVPVTPGETSNFTDAARGPVSDDYTRDRSDPDYPPPREAVPAPITPADADSTDARSGNAVRTSERASENYTPADPISAPDGGPPDAIGAVGQPAPSPPREAAPNAAPADRPANPDMGFAPNSGAAPDMGAPMDPADLDASVPPPERPDSGYVIPPPMGLKGGEWFDPDKAGAAVLRIESALVNLVPVIGTIKGLYEALSGYDVLTDDKLDAVDRVLNTLPAVSWALTEMAAAAKLETTLREFKGADEFSSAMREIARTSGDADMLVESLLVRLEALREMQRMGADNVAAAAQMLEVVGQLEKLLDRVDEIADVAGVIGALPPNYDRDPQAQAPPPASGAVPAAAVGAAAAATLGPSLDTWAASWDQGATDLSNGSLDFVPLDANLPALDSVGIASFAPDDPGNFMGDVLSAADLADPGMSFAPQGIEDYAQGASFSDLGALSASSAAVTDGSAVLATFDASLDPGIAQSIAPEHGSAAGGDHHGGPPGGEHGMGGGDHSHGPGGLGGYDDGSGGGFGGFDPGGGGGGEF